MFESFDQHFVQTHVKLKGFGLLHVEGKNYKSKKEKAKFPDRLTLGERRVVTRVNDIIALHNLLPVTRQTR